jgi:TonB family protein
LLPLAGHFTQVPSAGHDECYGDFSPTIIDLLANIDPFKLLSMRRSLSLMLSFGVLACSTAVQNMQAQSTDPNDLQAAVVITKLAQPNYPPLALEARIQGDVQIAVGVRRDGTVESASVASGHPILGRAALQSAQNSEYECRRCSEAVTSYSLVYTFRLEVSSPGQSRAIPITQVGNHVTVIGEPPTTTVTNSDPPSSFRVRSAKCLYLWKCGLR